jgi:hypothetical protein
MFVSEVGEAMMMGLGGKPQRVVDESNDSFAKWLGEGMHRDLYHAYHRCMYRYEKLANINPVADYNADRLYMTF